MFYLQVHQLDRQIQGVQEVPESGVLFNLFIEDVHRIKP